MTVDDSELSQAPADPAGQVAVRGMVSLVDLTPDMEHVLSGGRWLLSSAPAWVLWQEAPAEARAERGRTALERAVTQGVITSWWMEGDELVVEPSPALELVDRARTSATFVGYGATDTGAALSPRFYVLEDEACAVVELVDDDVHQYRAMSRDRVVESLATWLRLAVTGTTLGGEAARADVTFVRGSDEGPQVGVVSLCREPSASLGLRWQSMGTSSGESTSGADPDVAAAVSQVFASAGTER